MNTPMILAVMLVLIESAAAAVKADARIFAVIVAVAAIGGLRVKRRISIPSWMVTASFIALLTILLVTAPSDVKAYRYSALFMSYAYAYACAQVLILAQLAKFYVSSGGSPVATPFHALLGILAMSCLGDESQFRSSPYPFHVLAIGFAFVTALYFASCQGTLTHTGTNAGRTRAIVFSAILAAALSCGLGINIGMEAYGYSLDQLLASSLIPPMQPQGFSNRARLDSVINLQQDGGQSIALRVEGKTIPGYLRGKAYDIYDAPEWKQTLSEHVATPRKPPESIPNASPDANAFGLRECSPDTQSEKKIWPVQAFNGIMFSPLETAWIVAAVDDVTVDDCQIISRPSGPPSFHMCLPGTSCPVKPMDGKERERFTALPDKLDPRIYEIAKRITGKCPTDAERIDAVLDYFADFKYSTSVNIPKDEDTLAYFLVNHTPAHCEYFASGAVVLLRAAGVPARYVTGFLTWEHNEVGDYYVARNRDAHAWAEAYDPVKGWTTVDTTPMSGRPNPVTVSRASAAMDAFKFRLRLMRESLGEKFRRIREVLVEFIAAAVQRGKILVAGTVLCAIVGYLLYRVFPRRPHSSKEVDAFAELHGLINALDRMLSERGVARLRNETPLQFASRIAKDAAVESWVSPVVDWYTRYCDVRYGPQTEVESTDRLRIALVSIEQNLKAQREVQ